jgi:hypothetical protein
MITGESGADSTKSTTQYQISTVYHESTGLDSPSVNVAVYR